MHTFDYAFQMVDGDVYVCCRCYEVRLLAPGTVEQLNPGVNSKCGPAAVYIRNGRQLEPCRT